MQHLLYEERLKELFLKPRVWKVSGRGDCKEKRGRLLTEELHRKKTKDSCNFKQGIFCLLICKGTFLAMTAKQQSRLQRLRPCVFQHQIKKAA